MRPCGLLGRKLYSILSSPVPGESEVIFCFRLKSERGEVATTYGKAASPPPLWQLFHFVYFPKENSKNKDSY